MLMYVCISDSGVQKELYRSGSSSCRKRATTPIKPKPSALSSTRGNTLPLTRQRMPNTERLLYLWAVARTYVLVTAVRGSAHAAQISSKLTPCLLASLAPRSPEASCVHDPAPVFNDARASAH